MNRKNQTEKFTVGVTFFVTFFSFRSVNAQGDEVTTKWITNIFVHSFNRARTLILILRFCFLFKLYALFSLLTLRSAMRKCYVLQFTSNDKIQLKPLLRGVCFSRNTNGNKLCGNGKSGRKTRPKNQKPKPRKIKREERTNGRTNERKKKII